MAGLVDALRGDGLVRVQRALAGLEGDPMRLNRARIRFDDSPPPYTSDRSGTTTRSQSPNPPSEEQRRRQERRIQLGWEAKASKPDKQFSAQVEEERRRIWNADPRLSWTEMPLGDIFLEEARETIKKRWVEQGIWNDKWNYYTIGRWKHEEPLNLETRSETDLEEELRPRFSFAPKPQPKPRRPKSDDEKRRIAEERVVREREREASRPYHQFVYQVSKARERVQEESANGGGADAADINTKAYEDVKNIWTKRGIWNRRWGILPGMSWKHEEPLEDEEEATDGSAPVPASPPLNGSHGAGEAPATRIVGSPSIVGLNNRPASSALNPSRQGPPTAIDSAGLENGDTVRSSFRTNSPPSSLGSRNLRPTTGQALLQSKRKSSHEDRKLANASLNPVHSSKVSKAAGKRKGPQRRLNISQKVSTNGLPLSSDVDAAEPQPSPPPNRVTPRRSKRIRQLAPSIAQDSAKTVSTDPSKGAIRSEPKRKVADNPKPGNSAKPQGVSKRQPAKTTRRKAKGR